MVIRAPFGVEPRIATSLMTWKRKPSHLGSWSQSSPLAGRAAEDGTSGRINARRGSILPRMATDGFVSGVDCTKLQARWVWDAVNGRIVRQPADRRPCQCSLLCRLRVARDLR